MHRTIEPGELEAKAAVVCQYTISGTNTLWRLISISTVPGLEAVSLLLSNAGHAHLSNAAARLTFRLSTPHQQKREETSCKGHAGTCEGSKCHAV